METVLDLEKDEAFSKAKFHNIMDNVDNFGKKLGIKVNKKAKWISRSVIFSIAIVGVGIFCFFASFLTHVFKKRN